MEPEAHESTSLSRQGKPQVIGIGRAGVRAVGMLAAELAGAADWLELHACDTDSGTLAECPLPDERKLLIDREWRQGNGSGGNVTIAQRSMARERPQLEALVARAGYLVVIAGLGGGTGTAGAQALAGMARRLRIPAVFIAVQPFSLEGHGKRRIADTAVKDLLPIVDVLIALPNDLLFSVLPTDTQVTEAFRLADRELARVTLGVADILRGKSVLSADFAMLEDVLRERKSFCGIGVGRAGRGEALNPGHLALERMIESPFLGGAATLKKADAVLLSLTGGPGLALGEVTSTFEAAQRFIPDDCRVIVAAAIEPEFGENLQLTALAIRYDGREATDPALAEYREHFAAETVRPAGRSAPRGKAARSSAAKQLELPLETVSRGIFINTAMSIYNGEDLDIPTWQRRDVHIDLGE